MEDYLLRALVISAAVIRLRISMTKGKMPRSDYMLLNIAAIFFLFQQLYCDEEWFDGERCGLKREHEYFSEYE
jgi:hypothetical protein